MGKVQDGQGRRLLRIAVGGSCRGSWNVILLLEGRLVILIRLIDVGVA